MAKELLDEILYLYWILMDDRRPKLAVPVTMVTIDSLNRELIMNLHKMISGSNESEDQPGFGCGLVDWSHVSSRYCHDVQRHKEIRRKMLEGAYRQHQYLNPKDTTHDIVNKIQQLSSVYLLDKMLSVESKQVELEKSIIFVVAKDCFRFRFRHPTDRVDWLVGDGLSMCHKLKNDSLKSSDTMNIYAVKKQQKKIAALLLAEKEAALGQATSHQRRYLIRKRMGDLAHLTYSKLNKTRRRRSDSINFYLKSFLGHKQLEKTGDLMTEVDSGDDLVEFTKDLVSTMTEDEQSVKDKDSTLSSQAEEEQQYQLGDGLPELTDAVLPGQLASPSKKRRRRKSRPVSRTILEQVDLMNSLRIDSSIDGSGHYLTNLEARRPSVNLLPLRNSLAESQAGTVGTDKRTSRYSILSKQSTVPLFDAPLAELAGPNDPPLSAPADQTRPSYQILELPIPAKPTPPQQLQPQPLTQQHQLLEQSYQPQTSVNSQTVTDFRPLQAALRNKVKDIKISNITASSETKIRKQRRTKLENRQQELKKSLIIRKTYTPEPSTDSLSTHSTNLKKSLSESEMRELSLHSSLSIHSARKSQSAMSINNSVEPFSETKQKSGRTVTASPASPHSKGLISSRRQSLSRRKVPTPHSPTSIISNSSMGELIVTGDNGECMCVDSERRVLVYSSCRFCYQTFKHSNWCNNKSQLKVPRCDTCGGLVRGIRTPTPRLDVDDGDTATLISTSTDLEGIVDDDEDEDNKTIITLSSSPLSQKLPPLVAPDVERSPSFNIPTIRVEADGNWLDDEEGLSPHTPSVSSARESRIPTPAESIMNVIDRKLSDGSYDVDYDFSALERVGSYLSASMNLSKNEQTLASVAADGEKSEIATLPGTPIDWTHVHKKAYLAALADARAKNLPLRPEHLANRTTRSFTYTYYDNLPWSEFGFSQHSSKASGDGSKLPAMSKILGKNSNIYDYYPGGKKDPARRLDVPLRKQAVRE